MKLRFVKMKRVELLFLLLWFLAFINAQDEEEPLRESKKLPTTATITRLRPSVNVLGFENVVRPAQPKATSRMNYPKTQTAVRLQNSLAIRATRTFFKSSLRATSTTLVLQPKAPMTGGDSIFVGLIIGCVVASIVMLVLVFLLISAQEQSRDTGVDDEYDCKSYDSAECLKDLTRTKKCRPPPSRDKSTRPGLAKEMITTKGGVIQIHDIILTIGEGCLKQDTEITLIKDDENYDFKSLLKLGLLDAPPRVVEFFPDGLKFLKPADLRIRFEKPVNDSELFVLHGSYNRDYQRRVWKLVTNDIVENRVEGFVDMKIHGFSIYSYIISSIGWLARILSHLNHSFSCSACVLYRRVPSTPTSTIDVAVVICSEFVKKLEGETEQVNRLIANGYTKGEHGTFVVVDTDRRLEMFVHFPDVETSSFQFKLEVQLLDTTGYVASHFKFVGITTEEPASGVVRINEIHQNHEEEKSLWTLRVREIEMGEVREHRPPPPEEAIPDVVLWSTRLSNPEISRMSEMVGVDWDSLAGLMDIPYNKREEIRFNASTYPDPSSKARRIFQLFNASVHFGRHNLKKCFKELGLNNLREAVTFEESEQETPPSPADVPVNENVQLRYTPLSSRETFQLSRRIVRDWNRLAGLMDIAQEDRDNIQINVMYNDDRSRAEKILSIFNVREDFSRYRLVEHLREMKKLEWIGPVLTGAWRHL